MAQLREAAGILMDDYPVFVYIMTFLFGICVGSFLNVCIYRIPEKQSIVVVPSHCMNCGKKLHWYELIPLFSWLFLRGKCSGCKSKISPQYPIVEAANGVMWLVVLAVKGLTPDMILTCLLVSALLCIGVIDARTKEIPFGINIFIFVLGLIRLAFYHTHWLDSVLGAVVIAVVFAVIFFVTGGGAIGGGDVKMVFACGLFVGLKCSVFAILLASLLGSVIHLSLMKIKHVGRELAFGPYLAAGYGISALCGAQIVSAYLNHVGLV